MKNSRWIILRLLLGVLGVQMVSASDFYDDKLNPEKISRLQIPLSTLQMLWKNKNLYYDENSQYYLTREPKLWQGNLYMFSIYIDHESYKAENYGPYFTNLKDPQYGYRMLTPITVRIWGKPENEKNDFYIGTYDLCEGSLPHFRFHIITIEDSTFKKFPKNVGLYLINLGLKRGSVSLKKLCKAEYNIAKEGQSLKDLLGKRKKETFKREKKNTRASPSSSSSTAISIQVLSGQEDSKKSSQKDVASSQDQLSEASFAQKERKSSSIQERRKGNITQLDDAIQ